MGRPVLFVLDEDRSVLDTLLSDLERRFGNDFTVTGDSSPETALSALEAMASANEPVALLLVEDKASEFLTRAHELHPQAKRVLLVDRDYSSSSPAVQAMALGRADYHFVRPWADDEMMYGAMSEYLATWTAEQTPQFELFRVVANEDEPRLSARRDVALQHAVRPLFGGSTGGKRLLEEAGLDNTRLPPGHLAPRAGHGRPGHARARARNRCDRQERRD